MGVVNMKIKQKLVLAFGIILLVFLINIIISFVSIEHSNKSISRVKNTTYKQLEYSNDINISVIQVQQYLSDASATKNLDSFNEAEKNKVLFKDSIAKLRDINPDMKDNINSIDSEFNDFYALGVKMANVYINEGYQSGNILMKDFDPMALKLSSDINEINTSSKNSMNSDLDSIHNSLNRNLEISAVFVLLSLVISIIIIVIFGGSITIPINNMLLILRDLELGEGDLTKRIHVKTKDEISEMAQSFNNFMDKLVSLVSNIKNNSDMVSNSSESLNQGSDKSKDGIMDINTNMSKVESDNKSINNSVNQVTSSVADIAQTSQITAIDAQEICSLVGEINSMAIESGDFALNTKHEMEKIESISSNNMRINEKLGDKAEEIGKIIDTIKSITNQTNLLALNAAIEAASAGEHGKGFGVVADEIRKLAENNNQSAKTIEELIKSIHDMIEDTISSTAEVGDNIKQGSKMVENVFVQLKKIIDGIELINNRIQNIAAISEEQSASTQELSATMESINNSNSQITNSIKRISDGILSQTVIMSEFNKMASSLNNSAEGLNDLVNKFVIK